MKRSIARLAALYFLAVLFAYVATTGVRFHLPGLHAQTVRVGRSGGSGGGGGGGGTWGSITGTLSSQTDLQTELNAKCSLAGCTMTGNLVFEGATADANKTTLVITDPTGTRAVTVPDASGTLIYAPSSGGMLYSATGGGQTTGRTITGTNGVAVASGDGSGGNPTISLDATAARKGSASGAPPATCAGGGDTYQLGDQYTDTATDTTYRCNGTNLWVPMWGGRGALILVDDFCGGGLTNSTIGELGWGLASIGGGTAPTSGSPTSNNDHPCYLQFSEGTDNDGPDIALTRLGMTTNDVSARDWGMEWIVKLESTSSVALWVGLQHSAGTNPTATTGMIALAYNTDLSHTNWVGVMCDSSTTGCQSAGDDVNQDATDTGAAASTSWVRLTLWHRVSGVGGASTFYASVNGGTPVTWCSSGCDEDLGNFPAVNLWPFFAFQDQVTGTRNADVDWVKLWILGVQR